MATAFATLPDLHQAPPACLGPYRVIGSIAEGGMGIVLRGQDLRDGGLVALKTVRSSGSPDAASLRREIAALGRMSHPGIVRLIADGTWHGMPWMAMELLRGSPVSHQIESPTMPARSRADGRWGTRPVRIVPPPAAAGRLHDAIAIVVQLSRALDYVHALGLVHRDVKPANVMVGEDGRVTLLDFGLVCPARGASAVSATAEICVGTMEYAAPEQIRGESVDARADIYSLGCVLYELVTGQRPVDAGSSRDLVAPSELVSGVPRELETLVRAMLAHRSDDRPSSAGAVAETLARVAAGRPR
jgi:eukaryotic-like serine/threonine-protein kinase